MRPPGLWTGRLRVCSFSAEWRGGILGSRLALKISAHKNLLARVFAVLVGAVGVYVSIAGWHNL
jgi:hypothetical protein